MEEISRKLLLRAAASGRIPNAYLFVGADNKALLDEAVFLGKAINCTSAAKEKPCSDEGVDPCESCIKVKKNCHPDLLVLSGNGKSIKIDEIRQVADFVKFGPSFSRWKVVIVEGADMMTEEASNSFLKTLEEPPGNILFILTTTRENKILRTIASRCQKLAFNNERAVPDETVNDLAEKLLGIEEMSIPQALAISEELSYDPDLETKLNSAIYCYRDRIGPENGAKYLAARDMFNALRSIEKKANKRLALDTMFLSMKGVL